MNLNSTIELDLPAFWHWWLKELRCLLPEAVQRLCCEQRGFLIVYVYSKHLRLIYQQANKQELLAVLERDDLAASKYQALVADDTRLKTARVVLRLTGQDALQKSLVLPLAAKENLRQVIAYEFNRYTPFEAEQVYFAVKKLAKAADEPLTVLLVFSPRPLFNRICQELKNMGLEPSLADYDEVANNLEQLGSYNLLPDWLRPKASSRHKALLALAVLLLISVCVLPMYLEYQAVDELNQHIRSLEKAVKEVEAVQTELQTLEQENSDISRAKQQQIALLPVLNELSHVLPDDTWLQQLHYQDQKLDIQGESAQANALLTTLPASAFFSQPSFVSPIVRNPANKLEHFQLILDIKARHGQ